MRKEMRKISKAGTMLLALVLTLALFSCNPSQAPDEGTGNGTTTGKGYSNINRIRSDRNSVQS